MATIGRLDLKVAVDSATFVRETQRINNSVNAMGRNVAQQGALMERGFASASRGAALLRTGLGALGVTIGVGLFTNAIKGALDTADGLAKMSRQVGVSVEALQAFRRGADLAGIGASGLDQSLTIFVRRMGEAARGIGELRTVLVEQGIELRDQAGNIRDTADVLSDFADALAGAGSAAEKGALANAAFGRGGAEMVEFLSQGSAGLREMQDALLNSTHTTQEQAEAAERTNDAMTRWAESIRSNFNVAVGESILAIEDLISHMKELELFGGTGSGGFTAAQRMFELSAEIADAAAEAAAATGDAKRIADARLATLRMEGAAIADEISAMQALERQERALLRAVPPSTAALQEQADALEETAAANKKAAGAVVELTNQQKRLQQAGAFLKSTSAQEQRFAAAAEAAEKQAALTKKLNDEQTRAAAEQARQMETQAAETERLLRQPFGNFLQSFQSATTNTFEEILSGGVTSFSDLFKSAKQLAIRFAAEMASLALFSPQTVLGLAGATGAGGAGWFSGWGGGTAAGGRVAGQGPVSLSQPITGVAAGQQMGSGFGFTSGGVLAGAGIGAGIGAIGSSLATSNPNAQIGATIGGAVGGIAGSYFGPLGTVAGGALGSAAGGFIGSLFGGGGGKSKGTLSGGLGDIHRNGRGLNEIADVVQQFDQQVAQLLNIRQRDAVNEALKQFGSVSVNFKGALTQDVADFATGQRAQAVGRGLGFSNVGGLQDIKTALETQRAIEDLTASVTGFDRAAEELEIQFETLTANAKRFGISMEGVAEAQAKVAADLRKAQDATVAGLLSPFEQLSAPLEAFAKELSIAGQSPAQQFAAVQVEFQRIAEAARGGSLGGRRQGAHPAAGAGWCQPRRSGGNAAGSGGDQGRARHDLGDADGCGTRR